MSIDRELLSGPALQVAPTLLGATLLSSIGGAEVLVRITEVEAYEGEIDPASHAFRGLTKRNAVMFGDAARLYCYFVYGMHWCANVTCGRPGTAAAVLLRAAQILDGEPVAQARTRTRLSPAKLASGPARLARVLGLTGELTGLDLLDSGSPVQLTGLQAAGLQGASRGTEIQATAIHGTSPRGAATQGAATRATAIQATAAGPPVGYCAGPRVGVAAAAEHPWRFWLPDEPSVSAYRPGGRKRTGGTGQTDAS